MSLKIRKPRMTLMRIFLLGLRIATVKFDCTIKQTFLFSSLGSDVFKVCIYIIEIKWLLNFQRMKNNVSNLIDESTDKVHSIPKRNVLTSMNFPSIRSKLQCWTSWKYHRDLSLATVAVITLNLWKFANKNPSCI